MTKKQSLKTDTIAKILTLTNKHGQERYFNKLSDMEEKYLTKLLKATEKLAK